MFGQKRKEVSITEGVIWKNMLLFFFPILIGTFFQQLYNTVDAIVVGNFVGKEALAAVGGTSGVLLNLLTGFFIGVSGGATVIIAQFFGANDYENVHRAIHTGFAFSLVSGAALTIIGIPMAGIALRWLGTPDDVRPLAQTYMQIIFCGTIPNMIYNIGAGILRAVGDSKRPLYFLIAACFLNILLDLLFVAVFRWGVQGVALATILSQFLSAILVVTVLLRSQEAYQLIIRDIRFYKLSLTKMIRIGIPSGLQSAMYSISNILIQASINSFGTNVMAGWAAYSKLDGLFWMIMGAFYTTVMTFSGQNFGARNYQRMRKCIRTGLIMAFIASLLAMVFYYSVGRYAIRLFISEEEPIQLGLRILKVIVPGMIAYVPIEILSAGCRSTGDSLRPMIIIAGGICGIRILWLLLILPHFHVLEVLAASYPVSWLITGIIFILYYLNGNWLRRSLPEGVVYEETLLRSGSRS